MRAITGTALLIVLTLPGVAAAQAAAEPLSATALEGQLRQLNATLGRLVELLESQLESSNAALLMQRVQLMTARIAPLEQELRTARGEQSGLESEVAEMELAASSYDGQLEREIEEGRITEEQARSLREQQEPIFRQRLKRLEGQLWTVRQRVIDLEQSLEKRRRGLETWEGEIDRLLGLR